MADIGNLHFGVHLKDYTDAEADKIKKKLENLSVQLTIDGKNVSVSHTDLIKKQIEDAIKTVSVQSVKIDTSALSSQVNTALQGISPQIKVTLLKGTLANDLQAYLNTKTFSVSVSITKSSAQNAVRTAFANLSVPVNVKVSASAVLQQLKQSLANRSVKIGIEPKDTKAFIADIEKKLKGKNIKVDLTANPNTLVQSVKQALRGQIIKAQVTVDVDAKAITRSVQKAINNARFTYAPNGGGQRGAGGAAAAAGAQRRLGDAYQYAARGAYESARASVTLGRSLSSNIRIAGELGTALGTLASVFGIKDLLQGAVQIGGQLENQRIALGAILKDGGKAIDMFGKIQALAVKSPFGIMDLNQYTTQLSAYGVEYHELYDTMKRLADISAGVGVDMGRIILAFGQVKAAGFLKGTELRQFTEANIPMVDKLAEKFSLLERRIVSAGEVYDMISEKKVTFEDVKSVLWDLTDEGGMFNNMQEVLSESLASKWKNLSDAIDVMYGKIADGTVGGGLKSLAEGLTELTKNWEYVATAIGSASAAFTAYKMSVAIGSGKGAYGAYGMIAANHQLAVSNLAVAKSYRTLSAAELGALATKGKFTTAELRQAAAAGVLTKEMTLRLVAMRKISVAQAGHLKQVLGITRAEIAAAAASNRWKISLAVLQAGFARIGAVMKSLLFSPWTLVFGGITAISEFFAYQDKKQSDIEERNKGFVESMKGSAEILERELLKIKDLDIVNLNTDEKKVKLKELTTIIQNEADGWQSILSEIFAKEADGTFKNSVEEQLKLLKKKMEELAEAKKKLLKDDDSYSDVIGDTESGFWFWETDIVDMVEKYSEAVDKNDKKLKELAKHHRDVASAIQLVAASNETLQSELQGKSLNEQVSLIKNYQEEWKRFSIELTKLNPEAVHIINDWYNNISKFYVKGTEAAMISSFATAKNKMIDELTLQGEDINNLSEAGSQYVLKFVAGLIKESAVQKPKVQQAIYDWFTTAFNLPRVDLSYTVPVEITGSDKNNEDEGGSSKDPVAEMWKKRADEIAKAVKMYDDWKKVEGKLMAENRVKYNEELANLFNGAYGFVLDLEEPTEVYEYIRAQLDESKEKQKELKVQLGVKMSDAELKDAQDALKDFLENTKTYIEKTTKGWDLYKTLFAATGNKEVSMNIAFGDVVSFTDKLDELKAKILEVMETLGVGVSFEELLGMDSQGITDKGWKGVFELVEAYKKEQNKMKEESIKNFAEIIKASKDFSQQIADIETKLAKDLEDLHKNSQGYAPSEVKRMEDELIRKAEEDIANVRFEEFKKSSDWVKVFDDLDRVSNETLDNMIEKVAEFAEEANLSEKVTKQLVDAMAKLRNETIERNPFKGFKDAWDRLKYLKSGVMTDSGVIRFGSGTKDDPFTFKSKSEVDDDTTAANEDLKNSALAVADKFQAVANAADLLGGIFESLGLDLGGLSDFLGGAASGAQTGAGVASAFGIAGPWGAIAGAGLGAISSLAAAHDKKLDKAIQKSQLEVEKLGNKYKNLEKTLERQLGSATSAQTQQMIDLLKKQQMELQKQYRLEDQKKKTDQGKLEDYKQQIAELGDQIKFFYEDFANEQYGVDIKGWAGQIADALTDAFASGEDAAMAFDKTVSDILAGLVKEMVAMEVVMPAMDSLRDFMFKDGEGIFAMGSDGNASLTEKEAVLLHDKLSGLSDTIGDAQQIWDAINKASGGALEGVEGSANSLSKNIQGVTENTADLLASYLNAIRADVSINRTLFEQLVKDNVPKMNMLAEAQLQQLQMIVSNTSKNVALVGEIRDLVNKVVDKGNNKLRI